jgi:hypothetical protein
MTKILTVGALGNDMAAAAADGVLLAAASSASSETSKGRTASSLCSKPSVLWFMSFIVRSSATPVSNDHDSRGNSAKTIPVGLSLNLHAAANRNDVRDLFKIGALWFISEILELERGLAAGAGRTADLSAFGGKAKRFLRWRRKRK